MVKSAAKEKPAVKEKAAVKESSNAPQDSAPMNKKALQMQAITNDAIASRAYQIWQERGYAHGYHQQDWLQAERELKEHCG